MREAGTEGLDKAFGERGDGFKLDKLLSGKMNT